MKRYELVLALALCFAATGAAHAGGSSAPARDAAMTAERDVLDSLLALAKREGTAPVLIEVMTASLVAEGRLGSAAIRAQRDRIARAQSRALAAAPRGTLRRVHRFASLPLVAARATPAGLRALAESPWVGRLGRDLPLFPSLAFSVPLIRADEVHAAGYGGQGTAVAVIDSGVDRDHPFFAGPDGESRVVAEACFSEGGLCPSGGTEELGVGAGVHCEGLANCHHGTHVAGIAAGGFVDMPAFAGSGVAPDADLISVMVASELGDADCPGTARCIYFATSDIMKGIEWVYEQRQQHAIAAINLSLGSGAYAEPCNVVEGVHWNLAMLHLRSVGIAVVAATGNDGFDDAIHFPACVSSIVAVGSTGNFFSTDIVVGSSNSSPLVHLLAPGGGVVSAVPGGTFSADSGTSMAAPHVAGALAVLRSVQPDADPTWLVQVLMATGVPIEDDDNGVVRSRIDVEAARHLIELVNPPVFTWP
jgi:subtilisin family serine protease